MVEGISDVGVKLLVIIVGNWVFLSKLILSDNPLVFSVFLSPIETVEVLFHVVIDSKVWNWVVDWMTVPV